MKAFYNEIDRYCCDWLSNLMDAGHITPGKIDDRPIEDLSPDDIPDVERAHFFAGIGGWDYALNLANWGERFVWTGSCPCQPFSAAGAGKAANDERHLWPSWASLIRECRPRTIFGEQVEAAIGWGWLDLVFADLEGQGYACASAVLPACGVGAPHIRQRLWFVAHRDCGMGEPDSTGSFARGSTSTANGHGHPVVAAGWADCDWLPCTDGKARPVESGTFPLATGIPGRVGRLRAYGNAIVAPLAAEFIGAFMECKP
jgi:DNA (cytosine-5)-methyltransferase 1